MYRKLLSLLCGVLLIGLAACSEDSGPENQMPTLTTGAATEITRTSAVVSGSISIPEGSEVRECGFMYSTVSAMTEEETRRVPVTLGGSSTYEVTLTGLMPDTRYYYCIYANSGYTETRGTVLEFTTVADGVPSLEATTLVNASETSLTVASQLVDDGGNDIQQYGFAYKEVGSTEAERQVEASDITTDGRFNLTITGLVAGTDYEVRAYATNGKGTGYGTMATLSTVKPAEPELADVTVSEVDEASALVTARIISEGDYEVTRWGFAYRIGESGQETLVEVAEKDAEGTFQQTLTNLQSETEYQVRAFVENELGVFYTDRVSFTTLVKQSPTVQIELGAVTGTTVSVSGIVLSKGTTEDAEIVEVGFCYSDVNEMPTTADGKQVSTLEGVSFQEMITGLKPQTTYYIRAYAINEVKIGYSEVVTFTTPVSDVPDIDDNVSPDK